MGRTFLPGNPEVVRGGYCCAEGGELVDDCCAVFGVEAAVEPWLTANFRSDTSILRSDLTDLLLHIGRCGDEADPKLVGLSTAAACASLAGGGGGPCSC